MNHACFGLRSLVLVVALCLCAGGGVAFGQGTSFSYQGSLADAGGLADGLYDFEFGVYTGLVGGSLLGTDEHLGVTVVDGVFTVQLDFGATPFNLGLDRYLGVSVRLEGDPSYTALDPRIGIGAVPYATHAEIAEVAAFAIDGPFAPRDTTPQSSSGVANQQVGVVLDLGSNTYTGVEPNYPIRLSREVFENQGVLTAGFYDDFNIEFRRAHRSDSDWYGHFVNASEPVIATITTVSPVSNECEFAFEQGIVSGYRLEQNRQLEEVIIIHFDQNQQFPNPFPISAIRDSNGFTSNGHGPFAPYLGGDGVLPDTYFYSYGGQIPLNSSVGIFPGEENLIINGNPLNSFTGRQLTLLHNVFEDRFSSLFSDFADGQGRTGQIKLRDSSGILWEVGAPAIISSWTLDVADDGGLFEIYEFQYIVNPIIP